MRVQDYFSFFKHIKCDIYVLCHQVVDLINHTDIFHGELSLLGLSSLPMMVNVCVYVYLCLFILTKTDKILRNNLD